MGGRGWLCNFHGPRIFSKRESNLEGVNIFLKFYISLEVVPIKQMDVVGESGLK